MDRRPIMNFELQKFFIGQMEFFSIVLPGALLKIKEQALGTLPAKDAINAFQWSKALLNVESQESLAVVQHFEADSKFFRCFTIVQLLLLAAWPFQHTWPPAGVLAALVLLPLALWRYVEPLHQWRFPRPPLLGGTNLC